MPSHVNNQKLQPRFLARRVSGMSRSARVFAFTFTRFTIDRRLLYHTRACIHTYDSHTRPLIYRAAAMHFSVRNTLARSRELLIEGYRAAANNYRKVDAMCFSLKRARYSREKKKNATLASAIVSRYTFALHSRTLDSWRNWSKIRVWLLRVVRVWQYKIKLKNDRVFFCYK